MSLLDVVQTNLEQFHFWTHVKVLDDFVIQGYPQESLTKNTSQDALEFVYPAHISQKLSLSDIDGIFKKLDELLGVRPKRIVMGIVTDDGSVVYYFAHEGLIKPSKV
ncbi:BA75_01402T0 [Komagataella pastoris]|uniref:BA75_01402T0 n=1 Tax=Komagataella pastoris TaxID=4922 RepID=A0A1B2J6J5_PICPA|nr:BA75_01402T0 [Komagataella pastoris]